MLRRTLLQQSLLMPLAWALSSRAQASPAPRTQARHLIVLWMNGGPSHIDTWDPKVGPSGTVHRAIRTQTSGLQVVEHLPRLAAMSSTFSVLRGVSTREGNHARAQHLMRTGYAPAPTLAHPPLGAWLSKLSPPSGPLPPFVSLGGPSVPGGVLGPAHASFSVAKAGQIPPNLLGAKSVQDRLGQRVALIEQADAEFAARSGDPAVIASRGELLRRAHGLTQATELSAFELQHEPEGVRRAFGDSPFGRACLTAVRLVGAGVRCVEVSLSGWDTHHDIKGAIPRLCSVLDPAMSALLRELRQRDLLEQTVVLWLGEFGRTPKINAAGGRDHHPRASSVVVAGGGLRAGLVHGATDERGDQVVAGAVSVADLMATVVSRFGLEPAHRIETRGGRGLSLTEHGAPIGALVP